MESFEGNLIKLVVDHYGLQKVKSLIEDLEKNAEPLKNTAPQQPKKRISKITAKMLEILEKSFDGSNIEVSKALKSKFMDYINSLDEETFAAHDLVAHANEFANNEKTVETNVVTTTNAKPKRTTHEYNEDIEVEVVNYDALKEMSKHLSRTKKYPPGIFWNKELNKFVSGPEEPQGESLKTVTFNDKLYEVGNISHRVYENDEEGKFCGYIGIDEFKKMINPT